MTWTSMLIPMFHLHLLNNRSSHTRSGARIQGASSWHCLFPAWRIASWTQLLPTCWRWSSIWSSRLLATFYLWQHQSGDCAGWTTCLWVCWLHIWSRSLHGKTSDRICGSLLLPLWSWEGFWTWNCLVDAWISLCRAGFSLSGTCQARNKKVTWTWGHFPVCLGFSWGD